MKLSSHRCERLIPLIASVLVALVLNLHFGTGSWEERRKEEGEGGGGGQGGGGQGRRGGREDKKDEEPCVAPGGLWLQICNSNFISYSCEV